jgi:hypothetical protein
MAEPTQDTVVDGVFTDDHDPRATPLVTFTGWVKYVADAPTFRVYTDAWFDHWYEIPKKDLVHQVAGTSNPADGFRSHVWVHANAAVTKCQSASAAAFAQSDVTGLADDPAGGYGGGGGTHRP